MREWKPFEPEDGERLVRLIDACDAIAEFVASHYGPLVQTEEGLSRIYCDVFRGDPDAGGWPSDDSTWTSWIAACDRVAAIKKSQHDRSKDQS